MICLLPQSISTRGFAISLMLFAAAHAAVAESAISSNDSPHDVSTLLENVISHHRVPGLAAVVLKGGEIVAEGTAGVRKSGATNQITINDQFLLCSGTKAMTATLVAMAVEEGRFSYTTTLGDIFPERIKQMNPAWKEVTLAQLLEHRAGVPPEGGRIWTLLHIHFSKRSTAEKRQATVEKILSRAPKYPPDTKYVYTALDYIIIGAMLEKVYDCSWEDLIRERLWQPLGITSGGFGAPGTVKTIDEPWGHWGMVFNGCPIAPGGFWARLSMPLFFGPGGAAHMTITDWAKFISLHLCGDPANPHHYDTLLKSESFVLLHRAEPDRNYQAGWDLGTRSWARGNRPGDTGRMFASLGDNGFWHTEAWVAPEIDFAVVVICNQGGTGNKPAALACNDAIGVLIKNYLPK
jgi:CubicO group peptidase (beta-lactamase class C family)